MALYKALWSRWRDSNPRPLRPERSALPSWATPRNNGLTTKRLSTLLGRGRRIRTLGTRFWSYGFRIEPRFRSFCFMLFCVEKSLYIAIFRSSFVSFKSFHPTSYRFISTHFQNFGSHLVLILKSSTRGFKPQLFINTRFFRSHDVRTMSKMTL